MVAVTPPTKAETVLLNLIGGRESSNNYAAPPKNPPYATASGRYQFIAGTWKMIATITGEGGTHKYAYQATPEEQDANALRLLRLYGPNSSKSWKASGPYPTVKEITTALRGVVA